MLWRHGWRSGACAWWLDWLTDVLERVVSGRTKASEPHTGNWQPINVSEINKLAA
jgi:hypothetical protein